MCAKARRLARDLEKAIHNKGDYHEWLQTRLHDCAAVHSHKRRGGCYPLRWRGAQDVYMGNARGWRRNRSYPHPGHYHTRVC